VGRYKAVLLKQRDIMIALTARLNERDETIIRMQEELKAYDAEYRRVEDALDAKTAELIALRRAAMQHSAESPHRNPDLVNALGGWAGNANGGGGGGGKDDANGRSSGGDKGTSGGGGVGSPSSPRGSNESSSWRGPGEEVRLRGELRRSEEARKEAVREVERLRSEAASTLTTQTQPSAEFSVGGDSGSDGKDLRSRVDDGQARVKVVELQYEQFRQEMAVRLEEKNSHLHQLEEDNARLRLTATSTSSGGGGGGEDLAAAAEAATAAAGEAAVLNDRMEGYTRERAALKTILQHKISTLVEGIARSVRELPGEAQRHPRLQREVNPAPCTLHPAP
jgi:hypothetical protein